MDIPPAFCDSIFVSVKIVDLGSRILIGNIYRSPNSTQVNDENLYRLLDYVDQNFKIPKLIVGDFNYRNINWYSVPGCGASARCSGLSENEMAFVNSLRENLLLQHVVSPTRQRGTDTPHILDLVLSSGDFVSEVDHLSPLGNSDHCVLKFSCELHAEQSSTTIKYKLDKGDYEKLNDFLNIDWDKLLDPSILTVDEMWEKFKLTVLDGMSKYIPKMTDSEK